MESPLCPLCSGNSAVHHQHKNREFLRCLNCKSVFLHPRSYMTAEEEKAHYLCHNNDPEDEGYQNFVSPVVQKVLHHFNTVAAGLDFGSGTGSPVVKLLQDNGYNVSQYDLYFHNLPGLLELQYNYITCTEVAEHFKLPYNEFKLLRNMLLPGGKLYIMTDMVDEERDFASWSYKNDHTHVFLYHPAAFEWIKEEFRFEDIIIERRVVTLSL